MSDSTPDKSRFNARPPRPPWGIRPQPRKTLSLKQPIRVMPPPELAVIPIEQCLGMAAEPLVAAGEHVLTGQPIARATAVDVNGTGPQVHASLSGTVTAIENREVPGLPGNEQQCVVIRSDGEDRRLCRLCSAR